MPSNDKKLKARISALEQDIENLKNALGVFAVGVDKVSQIQANQMDALEGLVSANEAQAKYIKSLVKKLSDYETRTKKEGGVFISYSHSDKDLVYALSQRFDEDAINYWLDDKDLLVGEVIDKAISDGIQKSSMFVIILSPSSIKSKWVEREFDEASYEEIEGKKKILPVIAGGLKANRLPPRIRRKLFVDLSSDFEGGYKKLRKSILAYMIDVSKKA